MPAKKVTTPLTDALPWLVRWRGGRQLIGLACLLPDCPKIVPRYSEERGAAKWFCSPAHRREAADRRGQLVEHIAKIRGTLDNTPLNTPGVDRRALESDLAYLGRALAAYPLVEAIRPPAADRRSLRNRPRPERSSSSRESEGRVH